MIVVTAARYLRDFQILVTFSDGLTKLVDLSAALTGPVFQGLQDIEVFKQFRVDPESETIMWPSGADIAPEYLYEKGLSVTDSQSWSAS